MDWKPDIVVDYQVVSEHFRSEYLPQYETAGAAGMDLRACIMEPLVIEPNGRVRVPTGIALQLPNSSVVALVYARSGLAWRHGISLPNGVGVIDSDYTGEVMVLLTNFSSQAFTIHPGDRIAQVVFSLIYSAALSRMDMLQPTHRGNNGFGSTGTRSVLPDSGSL